MKQLLGKEVAYLFLFLEIFAVVTPEAGPASHTPQSARHIRLLGRIGQLRQASPQRLSHYTLLMLVLVHDDVVRGDQADHVHVIPEDVEKI